MINCAGSDKDFQRSGSKTILAYGTDLLLVCFLIAAVIKFLYGIEAIRDIGLYDETAYLSRGVQLIKNGLPRAQHAPLYAVWYYLLSLFEKDHIQLYFWNYKLLIGLTTLALYVYLRRIQVVPLLAAVVSFIYLVSGIPLIPIHSSFFALLIFLLFLIFTTFTKSEEAFYSLLGLGILFTSWVRAEYFIAFILLCGLFAYYIFRKVKTGLAKSELNRIAIFTFSIAVASLLYFFGCPLTGGEPFSGGRSWVAFGQHFAANYVSWHHISINPWTHFKEINETVFGDANTIMDAAAYNGKEFFRHILWNASNYLRLLIAMPLSVFYFALPSVNNIFRKIEMLIILTAVIYLFINKSKIKKNIDNDIIHRLSITTAVVSAAVLPAAFIIYAKDRYLIIQAVILMVYISYLISCAFMTNTKINRMRIAGPIFLGFLVFQLTPNVATALDLQPTVRTAGQSVLRFGQQNLNTIRFLRALKIDAAVNMLDAEGPYEVYLGHNYRWISVFMKNKRFNRFVRNRKINMIVLNKDLEKDSRFMEDAEFQAFLKQPERLQFVKIKIPNTDRYLLIENQLLRK